MHWILEDPICQLLLTPRHSFKEKENKIGPGWTGLKPTVMSSAQSFTLVL
jgi:hypothetical protein